ncbi:RelA/SpoT family protein [Sediminivirga luteola]|uniref:GTP pyrophosphokinase n=1 Tax=Sediminivirga luteola TaxID=1774748 RepID=A0A8J2XLE8_9MICO|nr:bifunctional (p)ppGpp synthetase/guanosine-3',5'-bis(diphosphate) 3'-pyrophosphohydrolase [Sediminivirga luteola]MCI2264178.1 bifunctional (p)ppGpp synthetase/guanosine-3',5'-bis(diphosphate) 3'-pyrophosphohydrolase [Sediminivirga luteola]GGA17567.1 GTP pyrophosphokinase [Sediminivirga luteola]
MAVEDKQARTSKGATGTSSRRGLGLASLAWLTGRSQSSSSPMLEPLLRAVRANHPKADVAIIRRAYDVARAAHAGQRRKSGEPYITHPIAVATILAELGMMPPTLAAALLHDVVEDTDYTLQQLEGEFGREIAMLVDGVTKLDKIEYGAAAQAETVRKMVLAMAKDVRVLVIKLADRLHNARTWKYVNPSSSARKAKETLEIYAPLAHRLGMNTIKWELEDLAFGVLHPKVYDEIVRLVAERTPEREKFLKVVSDQITADLKDAKIRATITGRPKHYYSIYQKMVVRGHDFAEIHDLVGVRVLVDSVRECYAVLGAVHARWNPVAGRFKDYIAMPKFNMYQSLHTTVIGPGGKPVEIQIRTHDMHRRAEYGVAAHWKYKDAQRTNGSGAGGGATLRVRDTGELDDVAWLRQLLDWQRETQDPDEFLDSLRFEVGAKEVFAFTPKGDLLSLPAGSTPVDFAYAVHTEVGHRTMGARVNGRLVSLEQPLANGDVVEIFTSKDENAGPSRDWLAFVKSARARNKIRQWFSKERREEAVENGRDQLARAMRRQSLPAKKLMSQEALVVVANEARLADVTALYAAIGNGHMSAQHVVEMLAKEVAEEQEEIELPQPNNYRGKSSGHHSDTGGVMVAGADDVLVKLARCCTPVPGDEIVGFVTRGSGVSVHRSDCSNVKGLMKEPERQIEVSWNDRAAGVYLVQIQVEALDRPALLFDITRVLSENHVNILSATVATSKARVAQSRFVFEIGDPSHLGSVLAAVRKVDGVFDVYRINGG